jgi:hypothetical protein
MRHGRDTVVSVFVLDRGPIVSAARTIMTHTFEIKNRDPAVRRPPKGLCIYCGNDRYRDTDNRKLGEEHIIAEALGGNLIIEEAACQACERRINDFEQPILKTILYAPRVHLGIRRKRRKRGDETIKVQGKVAGKDVEIFLPIKNVPVLLFLLRLGPPGILNNRPSNIAEMEGAWFAHLTPGPLVPAGFESFASPTLDTYKFCQFLAKIAHCFAVDVLGDGFTPLLLDVIREEARSTRYDLIGGARNDDHSENLHELALIRQRAGGVDYALVRIRLFANLGAPTYLVVAGSLPPVAI